MFRRDHKIDPPTQTTTSVHLPSPEEMRGRCAIDRHERDARAGVVSVAGELDLASAPQLKWTLLDAFEEGRKEIVLDLSQTTFMDSTALGVLVGVARSLSAGERLAIVCAQPAVLKIFELSGMDGAFEIFATLDAALTEDRTNAARAS